MQQAQGAIDAARAAGANEYAHDELAAAEDALKHAHDAVADRDYRQALNDALDSRERAQAAAKDAADHKAQVRTEADRALTAASAALDAARAKLQAARSARVPNRTLASSHAALLAATDAVQKARAAFDRGDYRAVDGLLSGQSARLQEVARELEAATAAAGRRRR